jgi:hypothetical protein
MPPVAFLLESLLLGPIHRGRTVHPRASGAVGPAGLVLRVICGPHLDFEDAQSLARIVAAQQIPSSGTCPFADLRRPVNGVRRTLE